ncbi:MAG: nucleotide pyrophosphohydrolase [Anaerolineae bacterium]
MAEYTLREAQHIVDVWVQEAGGYWHPLSQLARLIEELGEAARLVNHLYGEKPKKATEGAQELGEECADILYTLICLANSTGIDLQASFEQMMTKLQTRDRGRFNQSPPG